MMRKLRRFAAGAATVMAIAAAFASSAQAHVTIGQLAPLNVVANCNTPSIELFQFTRFSGESYEVKNGGAITSWSTVGAAGAAGQSLEFKIFRSHEGEYSVVGHSGPFPINPGVNTFKVDIPVNTGDVIGLNTANSSVTAPGACEFGGQAIQDIVRTFDGNAADGAKLPSAFFSDPNFRVNVSATFLASPEINLPGRVALGSIAGGGSVVLEGHNFEEVSAVTFGGVPAASFTVNSESQITAIAPRGSTLAEIPAAITTPAGTATTPSRLAYSGCVVPKLAGKKLAAAKGLIKAAGCAQGKVKRVHGPKKKRGKVLKQSPAPGTLVAPGAKVAIKVGK
jgi:hypothetical protein